MISIESDAKKCRFNFQEVDPRFDISEQNPKLLGMAHDQCPGLRDSLSFLKRSIPIPRDSSFGVDHSFYRLPDHKRSFCYALRRNARRNNLFNSKVLVFKGTEPLISDFPKELRQMTSAPYHRSWFDDGSGFMSSRVSDHFPMREWKLPGALRLGEALNEASIALEVQSRYMDVYGELAPLPLPLIVHRLPEKDVAKVRDLYQRHLSPPAFKRSEQLLQDGLAAYIYYFPASTLRVGDCARAETGHLVSRHFEGDFDHKKAVSSWLRLFVRLLYLGYFPYTEWNNGLGSCLDPGNATIINGGCCDVDSIVPFRDSPDPVFSAHATLHSLTHLLRLVDSVFFNDLQGGAFGPLTQFYVLDQIRALIVSEKPAAVNLPSDVEAILNFKGTNGLLKLRDYYVSQCEMHLKGL